MGKIAQLLSHPDELKAVIQLKFFRNVVYPMKITSETEKVCYDLLTHSSRSFVAVIKELNPELRNAIMIFYLVLRALDTIEDDMTLDPKVKIPILRTFDQKLLTNDWSFNDSGPNEKDRVVLIEFTSVLAEYHKLKPEYQDIIKDITLDMGNGMADYIGDEEFNLNGVKTIKDYDLYCHYVAGLVGEGLTKISCAAKFSNESLLNEMELSESMGLFLQKTNIIRDYHEDFEDGRSFWPEEVWAEYTDKLGDFVKPENYEKGLHCVSHLVLNAMDHIKDCLVYLAKVYDPSTFSFCAIPQVMAIATLAEVFQNKEIFKRNVKIRKGTACKLILESRTFEDVLNVFSQYLRVIHHKCPVSDPHYLSIGIKCGELEQFIEELNPNPSHLPKGVKPLETENYLSALTKINLDKPMKEVVKRESSNATNSVMLFSVSFISLVYYLYSLF